MITQEVVEFLKEIPPFNFLNEKTLKNIAKKVSMQFYPKGTEILSQAGSPSDYLYLIKKGGVKVFMRSGSEEIIVDYRSEGDTFGFISLYSGDKSRTSVVAIEDLICYLIDKETFNKVGNENPKFMEFFLKSYLNKYSGKAFVEIYEKDVLSHGGSAAIPAITVGDMTSRRLVVGAENISIKEAAKIMSDNKVSSLVIIDENKKPVGIITDKDLREKVIATGKNIEDPVKDIMSTTLYTIQATDYSFDALLMMVRHNIHHLPVMNNGTLIGMLTNHDLMILRGASPVTIAREIEQQRRVECLAGIVPDIEKLVDVLIKEGVKATNISRIMSELNDRLVKKIISLTIEELGPPPVPFCWIVYGSDGRKEQTFKTDQDNAIIYADPIDKEQEVNALYYFNQFAAAINDGLRKCGFPPCPAGYMANNPKWCQPLHVWKRYFTEWITLATPEAVLYSTIFFDFRPVDGDLSLGKELKSHLFKILKEETFFLKQMSIMMTNVRPPLGFFKTFVVEKSGEHKNELNLKTSGIALLVDIVRLCALERGVEETPTLERLKLLRGKHELLDNYSEEIEQSFEFLMRLRLNHQREQLNNGKDPDNFINPDQLSVLEKHNLREIFLMIARIQDQIDQRYRLGAVTR